MVRRERVVLCDRSRSFRASEVSEILENTTLLAGTDPSLSSSSSAVTDSTSLANNPNIVPPPDENVIVTNLGKFQLKYAPKILRKESEERVASMSPSPPLAPSFIEKNWAFYVKESFDSLKTEVFRAFKQCGMEVDYMFDSTRYFVAGIAYFMGQCLSFQVNFFQAENHEILVEFQRHNGHNSVFGKLFASCVGYLSFVIGKVTPYDLSGPSYESLLARFDAWMPFHCVASDELVESMLWMISSRACENREEGLTSLVSMSYDAVNLPLLCQNEQLKQAIQDLAFDDFCRRDMQLLRLLVTLLANLTSDAEYFPSFASLEEIGHWFCIFEDIANERVTCESSLHSNEQRFSSHLSEILRQLNRLRENITKLHAI